MKLKACQHEKRTAAFVKRKNKVKLKAGKHLVDRERAATHQAPTTTHPSATPPSQQFNSSTTAVEQHIPTNPQRQHTVANTAVQRYTCGPVVRQELCGICTFFTILYLSGKNASRPREKLFMPPRLRSWDSTAVASPRTPRACVGGGRGTVVRSPGAGRQTVERRVVSVPVSEYP